MLAASGTYTEDFDDPEYEECLRMWQNIVRAMADRFSIFLYNIAGIKIRLSNVSYPPNNLLIHQAVINAFSDIKRIKEFHDIGKVDTLKFTAYICYWLAKAKPFGLRIDEYVSPIKESGTFQAGVFNLCVSINEMFIADFIFATTFFKDASQNVMNANRVCSQSRKDGNFRSLCHKTIRESLHYYLCYRLRSAQELELFLKGLLACPVDCTATFRKQV
jgi:hypothetical protein